MKSDGVAIVSGGMDSVTLAHWLVSQGRRPHLLSFDYGQRHKKELLYAEECAERLGLNWSLVDLSTLTELIGTSALTFGEDVPEGHYAEDNMALTVVPNRNMMMLSIAGAVAVSEQGSYIAAGMHAGDHAQYPDCREDFIFPFWNTLMQANQGFIDESFLVITPFLHKSKNGIAQLALDLGVPLHKTWSCYKGQETHCGRCGTCVERLEAIASVNAPPHWDLTEYEDTEFWKTAVAEFQTTK